MHSSVARRLLIPIGLAVLIGAAVLLRMVRSGVQPIRVGPAPAHHAQEVAYRDGRATRIWDAQVLREDYLEESSPDQPGTPVTGAVIEIQASAGDHAQTSAITNDKGHFRIGIPTSLDTFWGRISAPGFLEERLRLTLDKLPSVIYLDQTAVAAGVTLKGTVRDATDLHGLEGARVFLDNGRQTRSKKDGQFELDLGGVPPGQDWRVTAELPGYAASVLPHAQPSEPLDVALYRSVHVSGIVRDEGGIPVEGVQVQIRRCPHAPPHRTGVASAALKSDDQEVPTGGTATGRDGSYRLELPLSPTDAFVVASAKGYVLAASPCLINHFQLRGRAADVAYDIALRKGLTLRGKVQDRFGQGIAGAQLWVDPPKTESTWHTETLIAGTDEHGAFELNGLASGGYSGKVSPPRSGAKYRPGEFKVDPSTQSSVTIVLQEELGPNLTVRITNRLPQQGKLYVVIAPIRPAAAKARLSTAILERSETEATVQVADGTYAVMAYSVEGFWAEVGPFPVSENSKSEVPFVLNAGAVVRAKLMLDGKPSDWAAEDSLSVWSAVTNQWVELRYVNSPSNNPTPARREGDVLYVRVPPGKVRLMAEGRILKEFEVAGGQDLDLGTLERKP